MRRERSGTARVAARVGFLPSCPVFLQRQVMRLSWVPPKHAMFEAWLARRAQLKEGYTAWAVQQRMGCVGSTR